MNPPPHNKELEASVVGAVILSPKILDRVVNDARLRADHFYNPTTRTLFSAALALATRGETIDQIALHEETKRQGDEVPPSTIDALTSFTPSPTSAPTHAKRLVELAYLRRVQGAAWELQAAVAEEDLGRIHEAERLLARPETAVDATSEPWQLADAALEYIEEDNAEKWPLPFRRLNDLTFGGLRPGTLSYVGGHSSMGKSILVDQILAHIVKQTGAKTHLFLNEMDRKERTLRMLAGIALVDFSKLMWGKTHLGEPDIKRILDAAPHLPFGMTDCTGWSVEDICREIRWRDYKVVAVDIVHQIPHRDVADLDHISRTLTQTARSTGTTIIAAVHLNEKRVMTAVRPAPTLGDIRGSGMFQRDASYVLFVHREQDGETGDPVGEGAIWLAKSRNGGLGGLPVSLNEKRMQFYPETRMEAVAA